MPKKPTLRDVSLAAGVSIYTVSRALNGGDDVAAATREHVLKTAGQLGYVPNRAAQELRKNTRSSVAVITASTSNAYYLDMMRGVQRVLRGTGRTAVIADIAAEGQYTRSTEDAVVRQLIQARTAGVIATLTLSAANTQLLHDWDIPVVFVDSAPPEGAAEVPAISTDNFAASMTVGAHLQQHGYRQWLFVAYPGRWSTRADRERGLRAAAEQARATLEVLETENDEESSYHRLRNWFDVPGRSWPDVIVAGNNPLLHGTLRLLRERGTDIPDQVALVAFDEFPWAPLLHPPLTVLDEDSESIGFQAAQIVTRVIDGQIAAERAGLPAKPQYRPEDRLEVNADLVIRRSCGC